MSSIHDTGTLIIIKLLVVAFNMAVIFGLPALWKFIRSGKSRALRRR